MSFASSATRISDAVDLISETVSVVGAIEVHDSTKRATLSRSSDSARWYILVTL
jgi:hypothetical protein